MAAFEFGHQIGGHPAAVFHLDALCPGPLADIGRVQDARRPGAIAAGRLASAAAHPAGRAHVSGQRIPQLPGVPCVQVDLVLGAVQTEPDGTLGGAAVDVIDEQGLYLLGHGRPGPLTGL